MEASLDLSRLLLAHTGLSMLSALTTSPPWNVPVALYGLLTVQAGAETTGPGDAIRQFATVFAGSFVLDILWLLSGWRSQAEGFLLFLTLINFFLKPITILAALGNLRSRGEPTFSLPGAYGGASLPSFGQHSQNETLFHSGARGGYARGRYADEEDEESAPAAPAPAPAPKPQPQAAKPPAAEGGGYHTLE